MEGQSQSTKKQVAEGGGGGGGGGGGEHRSKKQDQNEKLQIFSKALDDTLVDEINTFFPTQERQQRMRQLMVTMHDIETLGKEGKTEQSIAAFLTLPSTPTNQNLLLLGRLYFIKGLFLKDSFDTPQQKLQHLEMIEKELESIPFFIFIGDTPPRGPTIVAWSALSRQYEILEEHDEIKQQKVKKIKQRLQKKLKELDENIQQHNAVVKVIDLPNRHQTQQSRQGRQIKCTLSTMIEIIYDTIQKELKEASIFISPSNAFSKILAVLFHYEKELDSCLKKRVSLSRKSYNDLIMDKHFKEVNHGDIVFIPMEPLKNQEGFLYSVESIYRGRFKDHPSDKDIDIPLIKRREGWGWYEYLEDGAYSNRVVMTIGEFKNGVLNGKGIELHYDHGTDGHEKLQMFPDGIAMIRIGEWVDGIMVFGRIFFNNGLMYYGEMKNGSIDGHGYMFDGSGNDMDVTVGTFSKNKLKKPQRTFPVVQEVRIDGVKKHELVPGILDYMKNMEKEMDFDMYFKNIIKRNIQEKKAGGGGGHGVVTRQQVKKSFQQQLRRLRQKTEHLHWIVSP
jgi:hypothetical protein